MGKKEEAIKILDNWLQRSRSQYVSGYYLAALSFALGRKDSGFDCLERAYEEHDGWLMGLKIDFLMDNARGDPRYQALLGKMNFA
jgi:hypothetical protein